MDKSTRSGLWDIRFFFLRLGLEEGGCYTPGIQARSGADIPRDFPRAQPEENPEEYLHLTKLGFQE